MKSVVSYTLRSDGEEFAQAFKVKSITIINEANRIPRAKILLLDGDVSRQNFELSSQDFFKPGKLLEVDLGYENDVEHVFTGLIVRHAIKIRDSNASYLEIECKHPVVKLTVNRNNRHFYDMSDHDAVSQILDEAEISHTINGMSDFTHRQLIQYESTLWDFILSRAEVNSHILLFDAEELTITPPSMDEDEVLTCEYGKNVLNFEALMDSESQFSSVESKTWSSADQDVQTSEGSHDFVNEIGNISSEDLAGVLNGDPYHLQHSGDIPEDELAAWAKSKATKNELSKIIGRVRIRGNSAVYPGKVIGLNGFGDRFNGKAYVTGVRHELSNGNWSTDIQFGLPSKWFATSRDFNALLAAGMLPAVHGVQMGVVTELEGDPDGEFRIRVRLPLLGDDEEGHWARMTKSYAGSEYGICFHPEIGDEVVVGFLNNDPRKAVVIGMLHSSANPSPITPEDDNYQKGIITKSELKILWDDEKKVITVSTPGGNEIVLDDDGKKISMKDSHQNSIEMNDQGITIESSKALKLKAGQNIDIEGINISNNANGKFTAEGAAGAEVKTGSIAVLKGSLVQIN